MCEGNGYPDPPTEESPHAVLGRVHHGQLSPQEAFGYTCDGACYTDNWISVPSLVKVMYAFMGRKVRHHHVAF